MITPKWSSCKYELVLSYCSSLYNAGTEKSMTAFWRYHQLVICMHDCIVKNYGREFHGILHWFIFNSTERLDEMLASQESVLRSQPSEADYRAATVKQRPTSRRITPAEISVSAPTRCPFSDNMDYFAIYSHIIWLITKTLEWHSTLKHKHVSICLYKHEIISSLFLFYS